VTESTEVLLPTLMRDRLGQAVAHVRATLSDLALSFRKPSKVEAGSFGILLILSAAVVSQWFRSGLGLGYTDLGLKFFYPSQWLSQVSNTWFDAQATGLYTPQLMYVPIASLMTLLANLGLQTVQLEEVLFTLFLLLDGLGMYFLGTVIFRGNDRKLLALISALFYMFNPFTMFFVWYRFDSTIWSLPAFPILLALLIKGLDKASFRYAIALGVGSLAFASAFGNPAFDAVLALTLLLFFAYHILSVIFHFNFSYGRTGLTLGTRVTWWNSSSKEPLRSIGVGMTYLATFVLFNAFWLIPWLGSLQSTLSVQGSPSLSLNTYLALSPLYGLEYVSRLTRVGMFSWLPIFNSPLFVVLTSLIPVLAFSSILGRHNLRHLPFFVILALLGLFLGTGDNSPLPDLSFWLFQNVPGMIVFRNPFEKAGLMVSLAYAPLFAVGVAKASRLLERGIRHICVPSIARPSITGIMPTKRAGTRSFLAFGMLFIIIGGSSWPMFTGIMFQSPPGAPWSNISYYTQVPSYYSQVDAAIHSTGGDGRVLVLPLDPSDTSFYNWQYGYQGQEPSNLIFGSSTISMETYDPLIDNITSQLTPIVLGHTPDLWKYLSLFSIRNVVVDSDFNTTLISVANAEDFASGLTQMQGLTVLQTLSAQQLFNSSSTTGSNSDTGYLLDNSTLYDGQPTLEGNATVPAGNYEGGVSFSVRRPNEVTQVLSFDARIENSTGLQQLRVRIYDAAGNWLLWQAYLGPVPSNVWLPIVLNTDSPDFASTTPLNLSNITQIYVSFLSDTNKSVDSTYWISRINIGQSLLVPQPGITKAGQFGNITLYDVQDTNFVDRIHVANSSFLAPNINSMLLQVQNDSFIPSESVLFSESQLSSSDVMQIQHLQHLVNDSSPLPNIRLDPISTSSYVAHVNASSPFFLVFSDTFDQGWTATVNGIQIPYHFIANGFANAWFVNTTGVFDISIQFSPQQHVVTFIWVSIGSLVASFVLILGSSLVPRKRVRRNHDEHILPEANSMETDLLPRN
jgi:hypothetical protein